jgi:hypothetical protein
MPHTPDKRDEDALRVTLRGTDVLSLMARFPRLTRDDITAVVTRVGPLRAEVEAELERLCAAKH